MGGICLLQNGSYMYYTDRFSTCYYAYFDLNKSGYEIKNHSFYWNENNGNYVPDEGDDFFFDSNVCTLDNGMTEQRNISIQMKRAESKSAIRSSGRHIVKLIR